MEPIISVITVCFDAEAVIKDTLESVAVQTCREFEYVIVDGGSTDGTVETVHAFIEKYGRDMEIHFLSERDSGIYDAMNKGIRLSRGEFCIFLNAGDVFYDGSVLPYICNMKDRGNYQLIYGDRMCNYGDYEVYVKAYDMSVISNSLKMPYCHQSAFFKRDYLKAEPFDLKYVNAADYNQCVRFYKQKESYLKIDKIVVSYLIGGLSQKRAVQYFNEKMEIRNNNELNNISKANIVKYRFRLRVGCIARAIIPNPILKKLRKLSLRSKGQD